MRQSFETEFSSEQSSPSAVTLLELMVGMALLGVMVLFFGQVLSQTGKAWSQTEATKERMQSARAIADYISTELKAALLPIDRACDSDLQFLVNPASLSGEYLNRDAIFWQAPLATERSLGDIAEIGYYVKWDTSNPQHPRSDLWRFFLNPSDSKNRAIPNEDYRVCTHPDDWISSDILDSLTLRDAGTALFAENVVGLWVRCLHSDGNTITEDSEHKEFIERSFDSRRGYTYPDGTGTTSAGGSVTLCALPSAVELSMVLLDQASARKVGWAEQSCLIGHLNSAPDAASFLDAAMMDPKLTEVRSGLRSYQTRIYLQSSR